MVEEVEEQLQLSPCHDRLVELHPLLSAPRLRHLGGLDALEDSPVVDAKSLLEAPEASYQVCALAVLLLHLLLELLVPAGSEGFDFVCKDDMLEVLEAALTLLEHEGVYDLLQEQRKTLMRRRLRLREPREEVELEGSADLAIDNMELDPSAGDVEQQQELLCYLLDHSRLLPLLEQLDPHPLIKRHDHSDRPVRVSSHS
mmetsp:Transcript_50058/g.156667  ORF Transcript_50058/g.156667 Transcript_50058/m.156667 type:complete len:200 (-) Transcript_50058:1105-1704(-)